MKTCISCRADVPPQVAVCPFCGARFADAPPREDDGDPAAPRAVEGSLPPPRQDSHLLQLPPAPMVVMGGAPARRAHRRRGLWMLVPAALAAVLVVYAVRARGVPLPVDGLEAVLADDLLPCGDAPDCVVVYLAPWDEASATTVDMLGELRAAWADDGPQLVAVVGAAERAEAERMARAIGGSAWIDAGDALPAALSLETVPAWLRVKDGRVVRRVEGTYLPVARQLDALGLPALAGDDGAERRLMTGEPARPAAPADEAPGSEDEAHAGDDTP